jgi:hypothetical protein
MRIADLVKKKQLLVRVRVPTHLRETLGAKTKGVVRGIEPDGGIAWVRVVIGKTSHLFRPQDLSPA